MGDCRLDNICTLGMRVHHGDLISDAKAKKKKTKFGEIFGLVPNLLCDFKMHFHWKFLLKLGNTG